MQSATLIKSITPTNPEELRKAINALELNFQEDDRWQVLLGEDNQHQFEYFLVFWDRSKCDYFCTILDSMELLVSKEDVSNAILTDQLPQSIIEIFKDDPKFEDLILEFVKNNTTIDFVLDKIKNLGMEKLNEYELELLKNG